MGRPEIEPKTPLGARLREVRQAVSGDDKEGFAQRIGIPPVSIGRYERGDRVPDADVLAAYHTGAAINLTWLATGEGEMFVNTTNAPASMRSVDPVILEKLGEMVDQEHKAASVRLRPALIAAETARLYNSLIAMVADLSDMEEVEAVLPQLRLRLKRQIASAVADPGSGKREAS